MREKKRFSCSVRKKRIAVGFASFFNCKKGFLTAIERIDGAL
jgi:hypothetical protein